VTLPGKVIEAPVNLKGFDCNSIVSADSAKHFHDAGFRFAIRYVGRRKMASFDIAASEASILLQAGLGLMLVQHVESPDIPHKGAGWVPTGNLGTEYGGNAAKFAEGVGVPPGTTVWCDLEGVRLRTDHRDVIAFCNNWHSMVGAAGFTPGLYVGFDPGLSSSELYYKLKFEHYWSAYNLNRDQVPAVRGVQMKQGFETVKFGVRFDPDTIQADLKGGLPLMLVDSEWTAE
jgi:hypothetical protein